MQFNKSLSEHCFPPCRKGCPKCVDFEHEKKNLIFFFKFELEKKKMLVSFLNLYFLWPVFFGYLLPHIQNDGSDDFTNFILSTIIKQKQ